MLEIIALAFMWVQMGRILESKGYEKTLLMKLAVIFVWFGGAIVGSTVYVISYLIQHGDQAEIEFGFAGYAFIVVGALVGEGILFTVALLLKEKNLPPLPR
jgi:hypothetical protein